MATLLEYKCPSCGAPLHFDSDAQQMKCPYCDSELAVEALKELDEVLKNPPQEDMSWHDQVSQQWQEEEAENLRTYFCNSCGGEIVTDETTAATHCPYCDNPVVMAGNLSGQLKPDSIIPFRLDRQAAQEALKKHLLGKPLLPKVFKDENHIREIKGVYVPFWLFDADAQADIRYRATRTHHWSDSRYIYTRTSHYSIHRAGSLGFAGVPVDGAVKMADDLMESIEPYDLGEAVDFQTAYLAGFYANKYDVSSEESSRRASERIHKSTEDAFRETVVGYATVLPENSAIRLENSKVRYALLPVWILNTHYRGKDFRFAMNGQTGKLVGDLPIDWGAFWLWWAGIAAAVTAIAYGISYLVNYL